MVHYHSYTRKYIQDTCTFRGRLRPPHFQIYQLQPIPHTIYNVIFLKGKSYFANSFFKNYQWLLSPSEQFKFLLHLKFPIFFISKVPADSTSNELCTSLTLDFYTCQSIYPLSPLSTADVRAHTHSYTLIILPG